MPMRILETSVVAPIVGVTSGMAAQSVAPDSSWLAMLIGPASGLVVSLAVLWFLKGYYDRSLTRDSENRVDIRELLERVITISERQQEIAHRATAIIEANTEQTRATNELLKSVSTTLVKCHEKHNS
jgi:hypothetical protein